VNHVEIAGMTECDATITVESQDFGICMKLGLLLDALSRRSSGVDGNSGMTGEKYSLCCTSFLILCSSLCFLGCVGLSRLGHFGIWAFF
jgi:hypothetical protein